LKDLEMEDSFSGCVGATILLVIVVTRLLFDNRAPQGSGKYGSFGLRWIPNSARIPLSKRGRRIVMAIEIVAYVAGAAWILLDWW
jgi:hypothetical protein